VRWSLHRPAMGNRISGRRSRHKKPTSGDVSSSSTRTGKSPPSSGSVSVRLRAAVEKVGGYRRGGREQIVSCPNLDEGGSVRQPDGRTADGGGDVPDLRVYRSYGGGFGETTTPDGEDLPMPGGRLTVIADSVPDIKIYRRSAVLYNYDNNNDDDDAFLHSNYRSNFSALRSLMYRLVQQDSIAIAKKTARCAQYMGALKSFESPHYAPGYCSRNFNGLLF